MKKYLNIIFLPVVLLVLFLVGCNKKSKVEYRDDFIFVSGQYEPIDVGVDDNFISSFDIIGIPKEGVRAADWDMYDIKLRCNYHNNIVKDYPIKVVNIPLEMRHYLGEVGEHNINLLQLRWNDSFKIKIIENPNWDGYVCSYFDRNKKLLYSEKVGYYKDSIYRGPEVPLIDEDSGFVYKFNGWKYRTEYISQDMQFIATYEKIEKTNFAIKPYNKTYFPIVGMVDSNNSVGMGLIYLGRVSRVAAIHGESKEFDNDDITIDLGKDNFNYPKLWQEFNENIIEQVTYENKNEFNLNVYGNASGIVNLPNFAQSFDSRYKYDWDQKAYLENDEYVTLSRKEPYEDTLTHVFGYLHNTKTISREDNIPGYYRLAVVASFDVYVSVSFSKVANNQFQVGSYSEFIMSPVISTFEFAIQYSKDNTFKNEFDNKLVLSNEAIYNTASMLNWNN